MSKARVCAIAAIIAVLIMVRPIPNTSAVFIIATWNWPDSYSQGINGVVIQENSTGSWVDSGLGGSHTEVAVVEWNTSLGMRILFSIYLNSTLTGASDLADGKNYHRENISVYDFRDNLVFSKNNLTYYDAYAYGAMYQYYYSVVLEFEMLEGEVYQVLCTCEIYYLEE